MVANAGIFILEPLVDRMLLYLSASYPLLSSPDTVEIFNKMLSVNVLGTFLCFKYASLEMIKQGRGGRLIAASSIAGKRGWALIGQRFDSDDHVVIGPGPAAYSASKFAIRGIMQTAAVEFGPHGITANAYAPGVIDTDMCMSFLSQLLQILMTPGVSVAYICTKYPDPSIAEKRVRLLCLSTQLCDSLAVVYRQDSAAQYRAAQGCCSGRFIPRITCRQLYHWADDQRRRGIVF